MLNILNPRVGDVGWKLLSDTTANVRRTSDVLDSCVSDSEISEPVGIHMFCFNGSCACENTFTNSKNVKR